MPIQNFYDRWCERIHGGQPPGKGFPQDLLATTRRKLIELDTAASLDQLRISRGNRLEALKDDRAGQHAIRVNHQFRICFVWTDAGPTRVEFTDYH